MFSESNKGAPFRGSIVQKTKQLKNKMSEKPEVDNDGFATSFTMFCTTIIVINVSMIICGAMVFVAVKVKLFFL